MLFNSYPFLLLFLPLTFAGFFWIAARSHHLAAGWLAAASVFFYGWWNPEFVALLLTSIAFNYGAGYLIGHVGKSSRKPLLAAAITADLLLLAYFKYANFFVGAAVALTGMHWAMAAIILPLGISFFTFTQIAFLVDVYKGIAHEYRFIHYFLFVSYFPHLIAGPILHHKQMMPQFAQGATYRIQRVNLEIGMAIFVIGMAKKVLLADQFALYANPVFDSAAAGGAPRLIEAWIGALAYALQLYFDFSGYSDMAIGLSRLFNVSLPLNFNSPYKAHNMIEFWRRWHMTLSAFLRDYLYVPLGGNRKGPLRRYANLMVTMLLGGMWHGAGWTFIVWGGLHGLYLCLNHVWRAVWGGRRDEPPAGASRILGVAVTFILVVVAWVPFRAADFATALRMLTGMAAANGVSLNAAMAARLRLPTHLGSANGFTPLTGLPVVQAGAWLAAGLGIAWLLPNTQEWIAGRSVFAWQPSRRSAIALGALFALSVLAITRASSFLYFQF